MFHKILVALDKSAISDHVFQEAIALAKATDAKVMLLHVLSPLAEGYPAPIYPGPDSLYPTLHEEAFKRFTQQWEAFERQGLDQLKALSAQALEAGVVTEYTQNAGDAGRTICDLARVWEADLVILGRRGHSGLSELFLGSVSNYVLHHAPCSVLTVQGQPVQVTDGASLQPAEAAR